MIPWSSEWAAEHCERFGLSPERIAVNLRDVIDFFESNAVAKAEAFAASRSLAGDPPKRATDHLPRIKAAVFAARAKAAMATEQTKPDANELQAARRLFTEFLASRKQARNRHATSLATTTKPSAVCADVDS